MKDDMKIEMKAGRNIQLDHLKEFITNPQDCESIYVEALKRGNKDLVEQNVRLKSELDKYIKMASDYEKALKEYAKAFPINKFAQETLKKWEEE